MVNHMIDKSKFWCEISKISNESSIFLIWNFFLILLLKKKLIQVKNFFFLRLNITITVAMILYYKIEK